MTMSVKLKVMSSSDIMQKNLYEKYTLALIAKVFGKSYIECPSLTCTLSADVVMYKLIKRWVCFKFHCHLQNFFGGLLRSQF